MAPVVQREGNAILALNAGSSSIKFGLYSLAVEPELIDSGEIEHPVEGDVTAWLDGITGRLGVRLRAVGHRVVHGGSRFAEPVLLTAEVISALRALVPLAPLHQPLSLAPIQAVARVHPEILQIACFDTAFHRHLAPPVSRYALPLEYEERGIRKYGFHGLSYEYIARRLDEIAPDSHGRKTVVAHLGNGASLCAMRDGESLDTTMGFSVLDGLVMGTRSGAVDPGVLLFLLQQEGLSPDAVADLLYRKSGLAGVSGVSGDMRALLASDEPRAGEAIELFVFRVSREMAAMANTLGGLDRLVFTGGIGEHAAPIRAMICERLGWLGAALDPELNVRNSERIDATGSRVEIWMLPTDEQFMIARHTANLVLKS